MALTPILWGLCLARDNIGFRSITDGGFRPPNVFARQVEHAHCFLYFRSGGACAPHHEHPSERKRRSQGRASRYASADAIWPQLAIPAEVRNALVHSSRVLVTGFGIDAVTADEAALKLKEGTYKWADSLTTEFALHGPPASYDDTLCALLIQPTADDGGRTQTLESVLRSVGAYAWTVGVEGFVQTAECHALARPFVTVLPFQRTVANVADDMGTNPDTIRTDIEPWKTAMTSFQL